MAERLVFWLKSSRPGLWFPTIWLYVLPLGGMEPWHDARFWVGLAFVTLPLNLWVYGWNDYVDRETDRNNPRKDSWLFGARGDDALLATLPRVLVATALIVTAVMVGLGGWKMLPLFGALCVILWAYNHPTRGLRGRPPWEICCQAGYLLVVPMSMLLNDAPELVWPTWIYLGLFAAQSHLMGEVMDVEPDRAAGRETTATKIGVTRTKLIIIAIVAAEVAMLVFIYGDLVFGGMLALGLLWLVLDVTWLFRSGRYTLTQMRLFGLGANALALSSMAYVWWSRCLLEVVWLPGGPQMPQ